MTRDEQRYEDQQADLRSRRPVPGSPIVHLLRNGRTAAGAARAVLRFADWELP